MKHTRFKRGLAVALGLLLAVVQPLTQFGAGGPGVSYAYTGSATVKAASLNVRSGAGTNYTAVGKLSSGQSVNIRGEQPGTDGNK
ncbi:MAG: SH3 domain-containing protein, partial [Clostridium sp.]|nr:SH3 domain-containing protein [Clostridium sp.]